MGGHVLNILSISRGNLSEYMHLLSSDEYFGIDEDRLTCFAAVDDSSDVAGLLIVQIFPEYIRLERLTVFPEYREKNVAAQLLEIIKERPEDARLPIYAFLEDEKELESVLEDSGFEKEDSDYCFVTGNLKDIVETNVRKVLNEPGAKDIKAFCLDKIPEYLVRKFVLKSAHDELLQFPDKTIDFERFSDGSIVCLKNKEIKAALLMEENEDFTQFTWMHGDDNIAVYICVALAKSELESEYGPEYKIRCLCRKEAEEQAYKGIFTKCEKTNIDVYKLA